MSGKEVLVCHLDGKVYAIDPNRSHADKPLDRGRLGNSWIACPAHGARFKLDTGEAINLPATLPIVTCSCRVTGDWIEIEA